MGCGLFIISLLIVIVIVVIVILSQAKVKSAPSLSRPKTGVQQSSPWVMVLHKTLGWNSKDQWTIAYFIENYSNPDYNDFKYIKYF